MTEARKRGKVIDATNEVTLEQPKGVRGTELPVDVTEALKLQLQEDSPTWNPRFCGKTMLDVAKPGEKL